MSVPTGAPFPPSYALNRDSLSIAPSADDHSFSTQSEPETIHFIPGNPAVSLLPREVNNHLSNELATPLLDELCPKLWLVAKKSWSHIDGLHTQKVKGRSIIPTEDPRLHLIWTPDKIYVKPVPLFLLNHDFWVRYLQPPRQASLENAQVMPKPSTPVFDYSIAIGFMRSYTSLVKYPLDFAIAKASHLIPDDITWIQ